MTASCANLPRTRTRSQAAEQPSLPSCAGPAQSGRREVPTSESSREKSHLQRLARKRTSEISVSGVFRSDLLRFRSRVRSARGKANPQESG